MAYIEFAKKIFNGEREGFVKIMTSPAPVLFLMIEESFFLYVIVSLWRSVLGFRTVGLLFRPLPAIEAKNFRLKLKRGLLKRLRYFRKISTISIVPATLDKRIAEISDDWIYDFQLWDMNDESHEKYHGYRKHISSQVDGSITAVVADRDLNKGVVSAIGVQDKNKAFDRFVLFSNFVIKKFGWVCVSGGKVRSECILDKGKFIDSGGVLIDRFVTDDEIIELYAVSDLIWCAYSDSYDQASGILGRAVQFGVPVIVREGSISHKFCVHEMYPHVAINFSDMDGLDSASLNVKADVGAMNLGGKFRAVSISKLNAALGFDAQV